MSNDQLEEILFNEIPILIEIMTQQELFDKVVIKKGNRKRILCKIINHNLKSSEHNPDGAVFDCKRCKKKVRLKR